MNWREILELNVLELAELADTSDPRWPAGPGGKFLTDIRNQVVACWPSNGELNPGVRNHIAFSAIKYGSARWEQFVDLGAWNEEPLSDDDGWGDDLDNAAYTALFQIGGRLVDALVVAIQEGEDARRDDDEDDQNPGPPASMQRVVEFDTSEDTRGTPTWWVDASDDDDQVEPAEQQANPGVVSLADWLKG